MKGKGAESVDRPLAGRRIVVTRPATGAGRFCRQLAAQGAIPVRLPTIRIVPIAGNRPLDEAIENVATYQWLLVTSANGAQILTQRLLDLRRYIPPATRIAAIGPGTAVACIGPITAAAAREAGLFPHIVATEFTTAGLVSALLRHFGAGQQVLRA